MSDETTLPEEQVEQEPLQQEAPRPEPQDARAWLA